MKEIYVKEGDSKISKDNLYTDSLYTCEAIYAIAEDESYLGHIMVTDSNEYQLGKVMKVEELLDFASEKALEGERVYIGIVNGVAHDQSLRERYEAIEEELEEGIDELLELDYDIERLDNVESETININQIDKEITFENESYDVDKAYKR